MNDKEFNDIVYKVTEEILSRMPEVIGNLIKEHTAANILKKGFYDKHPGFKDNLPLVRRVIEQTESENAGVSYEKLLNIAAPLIQDKIRLMKSCNTDIKPDIKLLDLTSPNGEI